MTRSLRGLRGALAVAFAGASLAIPGHAAPGCTVDGALLKSSDGWTRIAAPDFVEGGDTLTSYVVDEQRPERLYVTNGVTVAASRDGGCNWAEATMPEDELDAVTALGGESGTIAQRRLFDVQIPLVPSLNVWAVGLTDVVAGGTPLVQPRVLLSIDGGASFTLKVNGLPQFARPLVLRTGASPLSAYLLLDETVPVESRSLWATTDAGTTWSKVSGDLPKFTDFAIDVFRRVVWAWDESALYQSKDGITWGRIGTPSPPVRVDVAPLFTTVVLAQGGRMDWVKADTYMPGPAPDLVQSVAAGPEPGMVAMSSVVEGITVEPPLRVRKRTALDVTPEDVSLSNVTLAQTKVNDEYALFGLSPRALYRRSIPLDFNVPPPPRPVVTIKKRALPPPKLPSLTPGGTVITLQPDEVRRVPYDLFLPPTPTPLDVYFMTDSTGSMANAIAAVQENVQDIVDDLTAAGINLHFGVADFRDYPQTPGDTATYPYKRRRAVGPIDEDLADALETITTGGGNGDDSALEAIYQAVTGAGRTGITASIPPGEGANFRKDALKVVLVASDDEMRQPDLANPGYPGPTIPTVIDTLNDHNVEIVGIRVATGSGNPKAQMEELARGAGSVAPAGGVDCDGDDVADIDEGEALVCDFGSGDDSIAPAFINMLRGLKDLADVKVGVNGPRDVVRHLGKATFEGVNVKAFNNLPVPVEYRCTEARYGTDIPVTIAGTLRGQQLVSATATVRCLKPPDPPIPAIVPKVPPRPLRAAAVPPPPPPQPNPNVNPNPNPNPQAQANAGFAAQDEQQHQLALAENDLLDDEDEYAFSAVDHRGDVAPATTLLAAAVIACAAAGTQLHLARRARHATNPSRGARR